MLPFVLFGQRGPYATRVLSSLHARGLTPALVVEGQRAEPKWRPHRWVEPRGGGVTDKLSLQQLAGSLGIPVVVTTDVNADGALKLIRRVEAESLLCAGFDRLFSPALLAAAPQALNLHPSPLPRWPGPSPLFWMGRHGDRRHGVTLHRMEMAEDSGEILAQVELEYSEGTDGWSLLGQLGHHAGDLASAWLAGHAGSNATKLVGVGSSHRARRPRAEDARVRPAEWDAADLAYFCNLAPVSRAPWMILGDDTFFVERSNGVLSGRSVPGQYMQEGRDLLVNCRGGVLKLRIQGA